MLEVNNIWKTYEGQTLLNGVSFTVSPGETVCLLGPSGGGKSTLLRIISGLETSEEGRIYWDGKDISGVSVHRRNFGLMFQDYALFPHRNVAENVAFGLRMQNLLGEEIEARVTAALEQVNMANFASRRVTDLSGGEQQRVALARALAPRPRLLMLDEPLSALDHSLREQLLEELRTLLQTTSVPAVYVTHDQEEAFAISDRVILLHKGKVLQKGAPAEVYAQPATPWAARFLGLSNLIEGQVITPTPLCVRTVIGDLRAECLRDTALHAGDDVTLLLRPFGASLVEDNVKKDEAASNIISGVVEDVIFQRENYRLQVKCEGDICLQFYVSHAPQIGGRITLSVPSDTIICLE